MTVLSLFSTEAAAQTFASGRRNAGASVIIERIGDYWQTTTVLVCTCGGVGYGRHLTTCAAFA